MPTYLRVRDNETGHEFSVVESAFDADSTTVIDEPATDVNGDPLPAVEKSTRSGGKSGQKAASDKENS